MRKLIPVLAITGLLLLALFVFDDPRRPEASPVLPGETGRVNPTPEAVNSTTRPGNSGQPGNPPLSLPGRWRAATVLEKQEIDDRTRILVDRADLPWRVELELPGVPGTPVQASVASRILVRLPDKADADRLTEVGNVRAHKALGQSGWRVLFLKEAGIEARRRTIRELRGAFPGILVEPDRIVHMAAGPDDTAFIDGLLWNLDNTGQSGGVAGVDIEAREGWDLGRIADEVVVAVLDSGIRLSHEDIRDNLWINPDEVPGNGRDDDGNGWIDDIHGVNSLDDSGNPMDDNGHGSHVAGIIAARGANAVGGTGVAWEARIMALKFLSAYGSGSISDAIEAIDYARNQGVRIINNSWSGTFRSQAFGDYMDELEQDGVIMVVAAGNSSSNVEAAKSYPAHYENGNILSVAAHDRRGELADFSNYGPGWVQISAPGVDIYSLDEANDQAYRLWGGTSMAAPHVTGVLALVATRFPDETPANWLNRVLTGSRELGSLENAVMANRSLSLLGALAESLPVPLYDNRQTPLRLRDSFAYTRLNMGASGLTGDEGAWPEKVERVVWLEWRTGVPGTSIIDTLESRNDTVLRVFEPVDGLPSLVAENDDALGGTQSRVIFEAKADLSYLVAVGTPAETFGSVILNAAGPPENDMLADATVFAPDETGTVGSSRNGSKEPGEPDHAGFPGGASVWIKWTPAISGLWSASTRNSDYDTLLAVYRGPAEAASLGELQLVAENDDIGPGFSESAVKFMSTAGETLYFAIDDKAGLGGTYSLVWQQPPPNDDFADRTLLIGENLSRDGTTTHATLEPGEPAHHPRSGGNSVWWDWTAPANGHYRISARGGFAGTTLAVYTGSTLAGLDQLAADFNSGEKASSEVIMEAAVGRSYKIAVDSAESLTGTFTLSIEDIVVPENDSFEKAIELAPGLPVTVGGNNVGASFETGEPGNGSYGRVNTVWYRWVPAESSRVLFSTEGSDFTTFMAVFSGSSLASLQELASSSFDTADNNSEIALQIRAGRTYHIQISGANNQTGTFRLSLAGLAVPDNDAFGNARPVVLDPDQAHGFAESFSNTGASRQPAEPFHAYDDKAETFIPGTGSLWWRYEPSGEAAGRTTASAIGPGTTNMSVAVYTGTELGQLTRVAQASRFQIYGSGQVTWNARTDTVYYIAVAGNNDSGQGRLTVQGDTPQDSFSGAYMLEGDAVEARGWNINATREPNEPQHAGDLGGRSIWYQWTPEKPGTYRISTAGSHVLYDDEVPMDTILGVYTGPVLAGLSDRAANDDRSIRDATSEVILDAVAGTAYAIAVDGWNPSFGENEDTQRAAQGRIHLSITPLTPPENDTFRNARPITSLPVQTFTNVAAATLQNGEPVHDGKRNRSVWYKWTAPRDGIVAAGTTGNLYDDFRARKSGIGVYTGNTVSSLQRAPYLPGYPESAGLGARVVLFATEAGTTYHIATDDEGRASASNLSLTMAWAPGNDDFANAATITGTSAVLTGHNMGATGEPGEPVIPDPSYHNPEQRPAPASVWWRWTAPASGNTRVDTFGSEIYSVLAVYTGERVDALTTVAYENSVGRDPVNGLYRARNGTGFLDFRAVAGTTYHIQVVGDLYDRSSQGPIRLSLDGPPLPPGPPTGLTALAIGPESVHLSWESDTNAAYHRVEWREDGVDPAVWNGIGRNVFDDEATVSGLQPDTAYHIRVRAENATGTSAWIRTGPVDTLANTLEAWRLLHFGQTGNSSMAANDADPDQDRLPNAIEFWLGLDPNRPGPFPGFPASFQGGQRVFTLPPVPGPLAFQLQVSTDLSNWSVAPAEAINGNPAERDWEFRMAPGAGTCWRLVILPPPD